VHPRKIVRSLTSSFLYSLTNSGFRMLPRTLQVVLFSATFPEHVREYASKFAPDANQIILRHEELTVEGIKQLYLDCEDDYDKYDVLVKFYGLLTIGSSIIFVKVLFSVSPT
jgi:ATP-dependent RNA helicase DDX19/DBP5